VQRHARARLIAVDQARIRCKCIEAGAFGGLPGKLAKAIRHRRPGPAAFGIAGTVAVAEAIGDPAQAAAIGHRYRHPVTARRHHVAKWRLVGDILQGNDQLSFDRASEAAQQHGAVGDVFPRGTGLGKALK